MDPDLTDVIRSLYDAFPLDRVYVFGSQARGDAREDSDVDLLVVLNERPNDPVDAIYQIRSHIHARTDVAIDVIVSWSDRFRERKEQPWTLEHTVATEGLAV